MVAAVQWTKFNEVIRCPADAESKNIVLTAARKRLSQNALPNPSSTGSHNDNSLRSRRSNSVASPSRRANPSPTLVRTDSNRRRPTRAHQLPRQSGLPLIPRAEAALCPPMITASDPWPASHMSLQRQECTVSLTSMSLRWSFTCGRVLARTSPSILLCLMDGGPADVRRSRNLCSTQWQSRK